MASMVLEIPGRRQKLSRPGKMYNHKNQKLVFYPDNIPSAIRLVPRGSDNPVPLPPTELQKISRYIRSQVDRWNLCWSRYSQTYEG
ncbi:hypothetical protein TNCV_766611 [Trichonephila clavipes]|nr:hypothetical protein TNCV_766611 [Trichonephila clavipes]